MKITLDSKAFSESVAWVTKSYDTKDAASYVALIVSKDGEGYLFHSNVTSFMKCPLKVLSFESDDKKGVALAIEGNYLQRFASAVSGSTTPLELEHDGTKNILNATTSNGNFTIPLFKKTLATEPDVIELGEVDDREYFDSLQRIAKLCDSNNAGTLPIFSSVDISLDLEEKKLVMMATDRYALGEISIALEPTSDAADYVKEHSNSLIPVENANMIAPTKGLTSSVTLIYDTEGNKFGYRFGDSRIALFTPKDAEPLPYQGMKDATIAEIENSVTVDTKELRKAIQTVSSLAWSELEVYFDITEDELIVRDTNKSNKVSVAIENPKISAPATAGFLRTIINEAFSPITTEKLNLTWGDKKSRFVLDSVLDDGSVADNIFVLVSVFN